MCRPRYFHWRILKHDQRRINTNSTQSPPENNNDGALFIHFISIILILKPGKGSKKNYRSISLMNINVTFFTNY